MFGASNNTFGGFGSNNQQPQQAPNQANQQQPTTNLFGNPQPSTSFNAFNQQPTNTPFSQTQSTGFGTNAFGTSPNTTGFGTTSTPTNVFGQPQNQSTNLFGQNSQTTPTSGFGGFGTTSSPNPASNTFGAFGSTSNNSNSGTGLFGQKPVTTTNPFGTATTNTGFGSTVFGQNQSPFGATSTQPIPNGTINPSYAPVTLAENESTPSSKSVFNSIVAMDAYKNFSFEELRLQDYSQGRKSAIPVNSTNAAFGVQQPQQGTFGSFGNTNQMVGFGQQQPQTNVFGTTPSTNTFGAQQPVTNSIFGQPTTTNPSPFGQQPNTNSSPFGAGTTQPNNAFGNSNNLFNNSNTSSPFGTQSAKPSIFGNPTTNTTFGAPATSAAPTTNVFGSTPAQPQNNLFGGTNNQNSSGGGGLFGSNSNNTQNSGGLFGSNNNQNNAPKPGGLFGSNTNTGSSLFGQAASTTNNTNNTFGFGSNNQQQPSQPSGGLFGNNNQSAPSGGLFGMNNIQPTQTGNAGGLFGTSNPNNATNNSGNMAGGLFGNNNLNPGGLFGQKPVTSTGSLFGNKDGLAQNTANNFGNPNSGGLFGSSQNNSSFGFGNNNNNNANPNSNLFGSLNNSQPFQNQIGQNSLFQSQPNQHPLLQTRVDQDAYGNNPLFANNGISTGSKPAIPIKKQLPTIDFKPLPRPNTKITKLRGFARSMSPVKSIGSTSPMTNSTTSNASNALSRSSAYLKGPEESLLSPKAFIVKPSPKKLTIDPATLSTLFRNRSVTANGSSTSLNETPPPLSKVSHNNNNINRPQSVFDPEAESAAQSLFSKVPHRSDRSSSQVPESGNSLEASRLPKPLGHASNTANSFSSPGPISQFDNQNTPTRAIMEDEVVISTKSKAQEGEYWTIPTMDELSMMDKNDLKAIPNFIVGRAGYGQVQFQKDVDLSGIENLRGDLCGEIVVFKQALCSVYPDDPVDKPPIGKGLNVPAVITLENCWAVDKATRAPLQDPNHPRVKLFSKRLMKSEDTEFIEYDAKTGKWTFSVEHFTTYGIDNSEEGSDEDEDVTEDNQVENESSSDGSELEDSQTSQLSIIHTRRPKKVFEEGSSSVDGDDDDGPPQVMLFEDEDNPSVDGQGDLFDSSGRSDEMLDEETSASVTGSDDDHDFSSKEINKKRPRPSTDPEPDDDSNSEAHRNFGQDWQNQIGLESRKVAVMQASLFARPDSHLTKKPTASFLPPKTVTSSHSEISRISKGPAMKESPTESRKIIDDLHEATSLSRVSLLTQPKKQFFTPVKIRHPKFIPLSKSLVFEKSLGHDLGRSFARSFRVSWVGQSNRFIQLAREDTQDSSNSNGKMRFPLFSGLSIKSIPPNAFDLVKESQSAERLLQVQFKNTTIICGEGIPFIATNSALRFRDFRSSYEKTDRSNDALIWELCSVLFDELDLRLPEGATPDLIERISNLRREDAFSAWLQKVVVPFVEHDIRSTNRQQGRFSGIFKLLSGNQIERACDLAIEMGNYRLATLIAQCGRSDETFKADILQQNVTWRELRVDAYIDRDLRKLYELISGNATISKGFGKKGLHVDHSEDIVISEGLDWKRALGLHIWFATSQSNFWYGIKRFEDSFKVEKCAPAPVPWYLDQTNVNSEEVLNRWKLNSDESIYDAMFHIIKMFVDPTYALETVLEPKGFGPSPFDYRMPWHLYIMLSRVLRLRDFEDRGLIIRDEMECETNDGIGALESNSICADIVTNNYADQLIKLGLWKWAGFVLLHLEQPSCREKALKELILRNIKSFDVEVEDFFINKLKIPCNWIKLAKAKVAHYEGKYFEEFKLLVESKEFSKSHEILVFELIPETLLRGDFKLARKLLKSIQEEFVSDWMSGGKIFLDYVDVIERLHKLIQVFKSKFKVDNEREESDQNREDEMESLKVKLESLIKEIPKIFCEFMLNRNGITNKQQVCINEMISNLTQTMTTFSIINQKNQIKNSKSLAPMEQNQVGITTEVDGLKLSSFNQNLILGNHYFRDLLKGSDQMFWLKKCSIDGFSKSLKKSQSTLIS
ncbi:hypothetical protein O181_029772 [Austropuccinia psidii MF-1]|uniref:Peptidase S59 domain-containing protein n=1 Tax=Austropuccinia psidii MF-1 TaxID=1389203 RepID=A0A9Q3CUF9_9BASI|nr:hypothetical protein [Austropuccinia psidii MF-1]